MLTLQQAITALQDEIAAALTDSPNSSPAGAWLAERVTVSLGLSLQPPAEGDLSAAPSWRVDATQTVGSDAACRHSVTIEFRVRTAAAGLGRSAESVAVPASLESPASRTATEGSEVDAWKGEFAALFGPPGFDGSARAAVFCDAF